MMELDHFPCVRVDCIPPECPGECIDGLLRPRGKLARAMADLALQRFGREPRQPLMRESMVADGVASSCQLADLGGIHRFPVLPFLVAGPRVSVNSRPIESECLAGRALCEGWHNEKNTSAAEGLEQRRRYRVVALPPIV